MARIAALDVADPPGVWRDLGFAVDGDRTAIAGLTLRFGGGPGHGDGPRRGVTAWRLFDTDADVARLPTGPPLDAAADTRPHPNGVVALDHLVVSTADLTRTIDELADAGIELRRVREAGGRAVQAFFKLGGVVLEVVGARDASGEDPPRFWGLAFTVADLDATATFLGDRLHPAKEAVQPGRRIATLDKAVGSSVPIAFMSADPRGGQRE